MINRPDYQSETVRKLSFMEMHLIGFAHDHPDMILKEIRAHLNVPQTTLSSIIAKLEKQGLLKRVINKRDLRSFSLEVTRQGRRILDIHRNHDYEKAKALLLALDEDERDIFIRVLTKISDKISDQGHEGT
jgi:DNA-binding MarR family transcriptional regulator